MSSKHRYSTYLVKVSDLEDLAGWFLSQGNTQAAATVKIVLVLGGCDVDEEAIERRRAAHDAGAVRGEDVGRLVEEAERAILAGWDGDTEGR